MFEIKQWIPVAIQFITTVVLIVWFFAKLDKRIELIKQEMNLRFGELGRDLKEIKDNHLAHLAQDVKVLGDKLNEHLINHNK